MSCQTAEQIREHIEILREITGDPTIEPRTFPFDAVIAPVKSIQKALRNKRRFPRFQDLTYSVKPYWTTANIYYWHHFAQDGAIATGDRLEEFSAAYRRRAKRLANVFASERRLIFFVSNTQPDLEEKSIETGTFSPKIRASELISLRQTIEIFVNRPFELILVTTRERYRRDAQERGFVVNFQSEPIIKSDNRQAWRGDAAAWQNTIMETVRPKWRQDIAEAFFRLRSVFSGCVAKILVRDERN